VSDAVPDYLTRVTQPSRFLLHEIDAYDGTYLARQWAGRGLTVKIIRGRKTRTKNALLEEIATAFEFPTYFGKNWDALDECITDLDWLPSADGYVLYLTSADEVLADESESSIRTFVSVLNYAVREWATEVALGEPWDRPPTAFSVVLQAEPNALFLFGGTSPAGAQEGPARLSQVIPISGTSTNGKQKFTGTYTIERFIAKGGKLYSVGTAKGKFGNKKVTKDNVRLPATVANATGTAQASQVPPVPLPPLPPGNACSILSLDLGPINLNLLGLVVRTNQIQLRIDAVQGPGNLLCGITGILNPSTIANTALAQLTQILNALLALSPRTPA
jgi:Barstar (barnase inhibitor)